MKTFDKKLKLNKKTVASLSSEDLTTFKGGSYTCPQGFSNNCFGTSHCNTPGTGPSGRPRPSISNAVCPG